MMFLARLALFISLLLPAGLSGQELRATWIARDSLTSESSLAQAMETLASNNFNVVFVNAWSRGYPLWRSQVFSNHTGIAIDPNFAGRDILAEAVAEGHRVGLHVYAWFEYGFVGGYTGYLPGNSGKGKIFDAHPDWVAKQQDGTEKDGSNFYWMAHTRADVQQFLSDLAYEVARNYDLDGIELDRIRYPSVAYGYDDYTKTLYQNERGMLPPANTGDAHWIRWRADKLNQFHKDIYARVKSGNQQMVVCNAPSAYSSSSYTAYESFCQDWIWWVNHGAVDRVEVQSYVGGATALSNIFRYLAPRLTAAHKIHPSFAIKPNSTFLPYDEITRMANVAQSLGLNGSAVWYYTDLNTSNYFGVLRTNCYPAKSAVPGTPVDWRGHATVTLIADSANAVRSGSWPPSGFQGFSGNSVYAQSGAVATMDYYCDVPVSGIYEVYAYTVTAANRTTNAEYILFGSDGRRTTNFVNQSIDQNARWYKLADIPLTDGKQHVAQLSNRNLTAPKLLSADALMISLNRRLSHPPTLQLRQIPPTVTIHGNPGQTVTLQQSSDLSTFQDISHLQLLTNDMDCPVQFETNRMFFRGVAR